jgi:hypothetical protein
VQQRPLMVVGLQRDKLQIHHSRGPAEVDRDGALARGRAAWHTSSDMRYPMIIIVRRIGTA